MIIFGIFVSVFMFSFIVILHELGHFSAARFFGVRVEEFGLGIPPKARELFTDKKGTTYTLNWLPLGGFVKLTGETPNTFYVFNADKKLYNNLDLEKDILLEKSIFDKEGNEVGGIHKQQILKSLNENKADYNLGNKPAWQQAIIILGGVFMNFILAGTIFSILFFIGVKPIGINTKIDTDLPIKLIPNYQQALDIGLLQKNEGIIVNPIEGSLAEKAGLKKGDIILNLNNNAINSLESLKDNLTSNVGKEITLHITKVCENANCIPKIVSLFVPENAKIGAYVGENIQINPNFEYNYGFIESIKYGFYETYNQSLLTFKGIGVLIQKIFNPATPTQRQEAIQEVSGPIGIVDFITNSITSGITFMFIIAAVISINLGVFNLLPLPALDGGRFIFITINGVIQKIFGRKAITAQLENMIHVGFFLLLIALSILIAYNDIIKIINN